MKKLMLFYLLLSFTLIYAQDSENDFDAIVKNERKSALKRMSFVTNPNTENYDIVYHRLRLKVDPSVQYIDGEVTTKYIAKQNLNSVTFDLANELVVSSVKQRNATLTFTRSGNNELIINLPLQQNENVLDSVSITYSGMPPTSGFGSFITSQHNSTPVLWTLSEPFGALEWWPCKQDLNDKVDSIDVFITAPSSYVSVSNGVEQSQKNNTDGTKTTRFHHGYPIPAYLIAIAVTNYSIYTQQAGKVPNQFPIVNYLYPEALNANLTNLDQTPLLIDFFESIVTPYPFRKEKYGHAQFGWGGGMEHTTVSFMVSFGRSLIAHELAHQWFGDKVTCGSWNDIWLNEGFATYLASLSIEHFDGEAAFISDKSNMINSITAVNYGSVYLTNDEATDVNRIFSSRLSYQKGAMVLNMLRLKLGTTNFYQALKNYLNDPDLAYGYAKTPDLKRHLEAVSGINLTEFFNDWVYNQGYPSYSISSKNLAPGKAEITINQTQSHPSVSFFEMNVPIRIIGANGEQKDVILDHKTNGQVFVVDVPFTVTEVQFDPKKELISRNNTANLKTGSFDLKNDITLYPNPAMNQLTLSLPQGITINKTTIYNNLGQKVMESTSETNWDISSLATGVYYFNTITNLGMQQLSFIKN
ncbi:M1 family aminopeptidase [Flavobacterium luteum]|uniref:Aminopeptidase N n=1 Tax=Flavobacterium luteum TaxID=2026654 RepID=A0A7J5AHD7_9FLAO|nr:M1 family aminopeptidase [Flavobacterium luteum]KAB1156930.1 T9SS type A sorting domain-containing protein [Flavobacterium luteum]